MIVQEKIKIKSDKYKKYYESLGYIYIDGYTVINVKDLKKNSLHKVLVKCDICGDEKMLRFQDYQKSTNFQSTDYYCKKCKYKKYEKTCLEKYGLKNISQKDDIKRKKKETCLKNWGVDNPSKSKEIKIKKENTSLKNWGVKYCSQNKDILYKRIKNGVIIKKFFNLFYQGSYEMDFLQRYYDKLKITNGFPIEYEINSEKHYYIPDFYLPELNLIVEIKSSWWLKRHYELCQIKENYAKQNYNYIMILDKNYTEFEKILKIYFEDNR